MFVTLAEVDDADVEGEDAAVVELSEEVLFVDDCDETELLPYPAGPEGLDARAEGLDATPELIPRGALVVGP